jgi:two-component system, LytTR family, response regulator
MNVVIIEDETLIAKDLVKLLYGIDPQIKVLALLESVEAARAYFASKPAVDLIFSDIQLADGVSFDIFKDTSIDCPLIFTTAYDEYAIAAFKLNSIDYLLKPIEEQELKRAIDKFKKMKEVPRAQDLNEQFRDMLQQLKSGDKKKFKTRFTGHLGKSIVAVPEEQVAYFTKDVIIFLVTLDGKQTVTGFHSLEELEELVNPEKFFRANRQFILNILAVKHIKTHFTGKLQVILKEPLKTEIMVSRERAGEFKKWFEGS